MTVPQLLSTLPLVAYGVVLQGALVVVSLTAVRGAAGPAALFGIAALLTAAGIGTGWWWLVALGLLVSLIAPVWAGQVAFNAVDPVHIAMRFVVAVGVGVIWWLIAAR